MVNMTNSNPTGFLMQVKKSLLAKEVLLVEIVGSKNETKPSKSRIQNPAVDDFPHPLFRTCLDIVSKLGTRQALKAFLWFLCKKKTYESKAQRISVIQQPQ